MAVQLQWLPRPSAKGGWAGGYRDEYRHQNDDTYFGFDRFGTIRATVTYIERNYGPCMWRVSNAPYIADEPYDVSEARASKPTKQEAMLLAESFIQETKDQGPRTTRSAMSEIIPGLRLLRHHGAGISQPFDPSFPFKLTVNFSPPEFMAFTYTMLYGGSEIIEVQGMDEDCLRQFIRVNKFCDHPRFRHLVLTGPEGEIENYKRGGPLPAETTDPVEPSPP